MRALGRAGGVAPLQIVEIQNVNVQVNVKLAAQEAAEVLVDEVIEAVLRRVAVNVLGQQCALGIGVRRGGRRQEHLPLDFYGAEDFRHRRLIDLSLLHTPVARPLLLFGFGQWPVLETNNQIVAVDGGSALFVGEQETALPVVGLLDVVLLVVGRSDLEPDAPSGVVRPDAENVGGVVLRRLDVVLVGVRPMQLDLFSVIGNQVGGPTAARIAALRDEVAIGVVAAEEVGEMVVNIGLGVGVLLHLGETPGQLDDFRWRVCVRVDTEPSRRLAGVFQIPLQVGSLLVARELQLLLHLRQQIVVEERYDLSRLQVHDPVQAEIEVPTVELEHLAQHRPQLVELRRCFPGFSTHRLHGRRAPDIDLAGPLWQCLSWCGISPYFIGSE